MNTQWSRVLIWLIGCWIVSSPVWANSYNKGLDAYQDGDYSKSYKILSGVVKKAKGRSDKAEAMALMGAAAAKMGKKSKAQSLFAKAVKLDSSVSLAKAANKDKSVRKLFSKAKKGAGDDDMADDMDEDSMDSEASKSQKSAGKGGGSFKGFIPFGLGFILNGEVSKGLIYGGAQAAGAVGYLYYNGEIAKANADAVSVGEEALAAKAANQAIDPSITDFLDQNEAFVKAAQSNQKLMVLVLLGGYGLSVADSYIFASSKSSGKSSGKKRRAELIDGPKDSLAQASGSADLVEMAEPRLWDLRLNLLPLADPALMLSFDRKF